MLLKKQTVWLLTMLSLVVVLSVYYITSPEQKSTDFTAVEQKAKDSTVKKQAVASKKTEGKTVVTSEASDEVFESLRMELEDKRSQQIENLRDEVASTDLPADKRSEAYDQMQKLNEAAQKEEVLETLIKAMGYEDALVRADGEEVRITVKSKKKSSAAAANEIIRQVKNEFKEMNYVAVKFQPAK
ncbi:SpoIIIAH-like family protein [Neobacillus sp. PS3-34]|uniref:SpoIIIAH-like family protein n=1 Tax=Neobacillus sp. PS3-34 TaxID=3070678 RepID=UPI0027E01400|nr:SpoIIIAH-like family protein [Neobacillus sp. PS3-34]WML47569.1 SpoIIIAH-like family protein [Neobacillus sp. PS3-34]